MPMTIELADGRRMSAADAVATLEKERPAMPLRRPIPPDFSDPAISAGADHPPGDEPTDKGASERGQAIAAAIPVGEPPPEPAPPLPPLPTPTPIDMAKLLAEESISRVRFSRLKLFALSPLHYLLNVGAETSTLDKGTGVHSALLKGKRVCYYNGRTKAGDKIGPRNGEQWERFKADNCAALILTLEEYEQTMRMVDAVQANSLAMSLIRAAQGRKIEDTIEFDFLGLPARTTPDARTKIEIVELKTCRSARPVDFGWQTKKLSYHAQHAFHRHGMKAKNAALDPACFTIAVENSGVPAVTVYRMTDATMNDGEKLIRSWFEQLKVCRESGRFPAYSDAIVDLDVPGLEALDD